MAGEVTVDALPYVDTGYDEAGVREVSDLDLWSVSNRLQINIFKYTPLSF